MTKLMSKSELIQKVVADQHSLAKKDVTRAYRSKSLASVGYKELKKTGAFLLPGFAKFVVIKKSATTRGRAGINPFTKEPTVFKAKPARKICQGSSSEKQQKTRCEQATCVAYVPRFLFGATSNWPIATNLSLGPDVSFRGEAEVGRAAEPAASVENDPLGDILIRSGHAILPDSAPSRSWA